MGIYLGEIGTIELTRQSLEGSKFSVVNPSDVNTARDRFSFDFDQNFLITGDLLELTTTDGTNLDFVASSGWADNTVHKSGNWYIFVDELGGIRLYSTFDASLDGGATGLVQLAAIARNIPIKATIRNRDKRILGQVVEYELNTNRETVDITTLSDEHRQQYSTLISGSGQLTAHWDYVTNSGEESVNYLLQLIVRTEVGASFHGKFYIKKESTIAQGGAFAADQINDALWWEFDAIVSSAAVAFSPSEIVKATINFVTTGPIQLKANTQQRRYLLQESGSRIELEQDNASFLLLEETE